MKLDTSKWPRDDKVIKAIIADTRLSTESRAAFITLYLEALKVNKKEK
jgi:hypothetical protein